MDGKKSELSVLAEADSLIGTLEPEEQNRVVTYLLDKFCGGSTKPFVSTPVADNRPEVATQSVNVDSVLGKFSHLAEFFAAKAPESEAERALVALYWLAERDGMEEVKGSDVNSRLKDLGYELGHVTNAMSSLMRRKPALVVQTGRGQGRPGRKLYKITMAGRSVVERDGKAESQ